MGNLYMKIYFIGVTWDNSPVSNTNTFITQLLYAVKTGFYAN